MGFDAAYRRFVAAHPDAAVWHDPDFCEALAPPTLLSAYRGVTLTDARGEVLAAVPVYRKWRPWGRVLAIPPFGRYADPLTRDGGAEGVAQAVAVLAKAFQGCTAVDHFLSPEASERLLPALRARMQGLEVLPRTTYRIAIDAPPEEIKRRASKDKRRQLRRAADYWTYRHEGLTPEVLDVLEATYARQGMRVPYQRAALQRLAVALAPSDGIAIGCARHPDGSLGAVSIAIAGARQVYCLLSGAREDARQQAGGSFVLSQAVDWAYASGRGQLDFLGSDLAGPGRNRKELGGVRGAYAHLRWWRWPSALV